MNQHHHEGFSYDIPRLLETSLPRRQWLRFAAATGAGMLLPGCAQSSNPLVIGTDNTGGSCIEAAAESVGPYPSDGSNSIDGQVTDTLGEAGVVRQDITAGFGTSTRVATGIPMQFSLQLVDVNRGCAPLKNHAVYVWHCDAAGLYSLYSKGVRDVNYLRGVQITDSQGRLSFNTIVPGCYRGRFPHFHFEVFPSLAASADHRSRIQVSQLAVPRNVCVDAYAADESYADSRDNFSRMTLENDSVFKNNAPEQLEAMTIELEGTPSTGYEGSIKIGVAV